MKRVIWMAVGVAVGVIAVRKISEAKATLGPAGLNRAVAQLGESIQYFADAVRDGMRERETELRSALGVDTADKSTNR